MNILVCVKQVPDTSEIKIDPVKNTLIRDGVQSILNPFDGYALEAALLLKDKDPEVKVTVVSMGPPQAEPMLKDCIAVGADSAYLVSDAKFGGSDTLATSYILTNAIKKLEEEKGKFDLILCGKQAIDGDTAQVGPEIAEQLDVPQVTYAVELEIADEKHAHVTRELDFGNQVIEAQMPCLVTFTKAHELRYPSIKNKLKAKKAEIGRLTVESFPEIDLTKIGLKGSPTRVKKTFTPSQTKEGVIIQEKDPAVAVQRLIEALEDAKLL
ncbi:electron transfer flavoprotein subunit beta/FixA family protein [Peptoniphilus sp. GNH]|nr:electron transfer flavoprotein subunit beta [Clostridiales bacterium KA00134]UHR02598.1 electron transfer flavoprotein subunit beta/FixA family protein [Peptoniphilus sp. GNH]